MESSRLICVIFLTLTFVSTCCGSHEYSTPPDIYPYITTTRGPEPVVASGVKRSVENYNDPFTKSPVTAGETEQNRMLLRFPTASSDATQQRNNVGVTPWHKRGTEESPSQTTNGQSLLNNTISGGTAQGNFSETSHLAESGVSSNQSQNDEVHEVTQPALSTFSGNPHEAFKSNYSRVLESNNGLTQSLMPVSVASEVMQDPETATSSDEPSFSDDLDSSSNLDPTDDERSYTTIPESDFTEEAVDIPEQTLQESGTTTQNDELRAEAKNHEQTHNTDSFGYTPTTEDMSPDSTAHTPDIHSLNAEGFTKEPKEIKEDSAEYADVVEQTPVVNKFTAGEFGYSAMDGQTAEPDGHNPSINGQTPDTNEDVPLLNRETPVPSAQTFTNRETTDPRAHTVLMNGQTPDPSGHAINPIGHNLMQTDGQTSEFVGYHTSDADGHTPSLEGFKSRDYRTESEHKASENIQTEIEQQQEHPFRHNPDSEIVMSHLDEYTTAFSQQPFDVTEPTESHTTFQSILSKKSHKQDADSLSAQLEKEYSDNDDPFLENGLEEAGTPPNVTGESTSYGSYTTPERMPFTLPPSKKVASDTDAVEESQETSADEARSSGRPETSDKLDVTPENGAERLFEATGETRSLVKEMTTPTSTSAGEKVVSTNFPPFETENRNIRNITKENISESMLGDDPNRELSKVTVTTKMPQGLKNEKTNLKKVEDMMDGEGSGEVVEEFGKNITSMMKEKAINSQNQSDVIFETTDSSSQVDQEYIFPNGTNTEQAGNPNIRYTYTLVESMISTTYLLPSESHPTTFSQETMSANDMQTTPTSIPMSSAINWLDNKQTGTTMSASDYLAIIHETNTGFNEEISPSIVITPSSSGSSESVINVTPVIMHDLKPTLKVKLVTPTPVLPGATEIGVTELSFDVTDMTSSVPTTNEVTIQPSYVSIEHSSPTVLPGLDAAGHTQSRSSEKTPEITVSFIHKSVTASPELTSPSNSFISTATTETSESPDVLVATSSSSTTTLLASIQEETTPFPKKHYDIESSTTTLLASIREETTPFPRKHYDIESSITTLLASIREETTPFPRKHYDIESSTTTLLDSIQEETTPFPTNHYEIVSSTTTVRNPIQEETTQPPTDPEHDEIVSSSTVVSSHDVSSSTVKSSRVIVVITTPLPDFTSSSVISSPNDVSPSSTKIATPTSFIKVYDKSTEINSTDVYNSNESPDKKVESSAEKWNIGTDGESPVTKDYNHTVTISPQRVIPTNQDTIPIFIISISIVVAVIAVFAIIVTCICYNNSDSLRRMKYSLSSRSGTYKVSDEIALGTPGRLDYKGDHAYKNYYGNV